MVNTYWMNYQKDKRDIKEYLDDLKQALDYAYKHTKGDENKDIIDDLVYNYESLERVANSVMDNYEETVDMLDDINDIIS